MTWDVDEEPVERPPARLVPAGHGQVLRAVLEALRVHPRVAWAHQFNTGAFTVEDTDRLGRRSSRRVRCGFPGCPDILGQMRDGRLLAVEVKRSKASSGEFRPGQLEFLGVVLEANGVAFVARGIADVEENL